MKIRSRVNARKDRRIFSRTAKRINVKNIPGHMTRRGGTCL